MNKTSFYLGEFMGSPPTSRELNDIEFEGMYIQHDNINTINTESIGGLYSNPRTAKSVVLHDVFRLVSLIPFIFVYSNGNVCWRVDAVVCCTGTVLTDYSTVGTGSINTMQVFVQDT